MDIKIGSYASMAYLMKQLRAAGATEKDFEDIEISLDYDACYYESDTPSIKAVWNNNKKKKKK